MPHSTETWRKTSVPVRCPNCKTHLRLNVGLRTDGDVEDSESKSGRVMGLGGANAAKPVGTDDS